MSVSIESDAPESAIQMTQHKSTHTPQKEKLRVRIRRLQNQVDYLTEKVKSLEDKSLVEKSELLNSLDLDDFKSLIRRFSPSQTVADFIEAQIADGQKKPRGRSFKEKSKSECLKMCFNSPKLCKNYLVKIFSLPNARVLHRKQM